jgi:ubiquinone biosynthesis protein
MRIASGRSVLRAAIIAVLALVTLLRYAVGWLVRLLLFQPREARLAWAGRCLASLLRRLGATFVKLGQILSTRPDLLPAPLIRELECLQDDVGPFAFTEVRRTIEEDFAEPLETLFTQIDEVPIASASVAQVHAATLCTGRRVAIKVRRPEIERLVALDLAAMRLFGRLVELVPSFALLAPVESIEAFGRGIRLQLDLSIEAENNGRFRAHFSGDPDVLFSALIPTLCSSRVLTMELVEGRKILDHRGAADAKRLAAIGVRVLLKMIFEDGLVHADLHPGNLLVTADGRVAILDLGLVGELAGEHKRGLARYFAAFAHGDGATMARLMTELSPSRASVADPAAFERAICDFVGRYHGRKLGEVQASSVFLDMMDILRRHRLRANPTFTLVNIAIMVTEGIGKMLDPDLDLMSAALPFFARIGVRETATPP